MAITNFKSFTIQQGVEAAVEDTRILLGSGSAGTTNARRVLTHPDDANFPPITYEDNPDITWNLDNIVLPHPVTGTHFTLGTTTTIRFERGVDDVIISEQWSGGRDRSPMVTAFFRLLYEYLVNPPDTIGEYITWQPRDRNELEYNVEFLELRVSAGGLPDQIFRVADLRERGGQLDPNAPAVGVDGKHPGGLDSVWPTPTGLIDQTVTLRFKVVGEV
ncbi:MAG: hypothetical protein PVG97_11535 [Syntrophobacterales bacterium]|jgi:hypothetical protein